MGSLVRDFGQLGVVEPVEKEFVGNGDVDTSAGVGHLDSGRECRVRIHTFDKGSSRNERNRGNREKSENRLHGE